MSLSYVCGLLSLLFFFQAEDGIRDATVTGVQTCALPISLRRIENARVRPDVTIIVDHYEENWGRLWWIRLRGRARVLDEGAEREHALKLLQEKYPQYLSEPPEGAVLAVDVTDEREWTSRAIKGRGAR